LAEKDIVVAIATGNYMPLVESYFDEEILKDTYLAGAVRDFRSVHFSK